MTAIKAGMFKQFVQNALENTQGTLAGLTRGDALAQKKALDAKVRAWAAAPGREEHARAIEAPKTEKPSAIILDLRLPQLDGLDFTREFRKTSNAPIIMLTARSEESDKLIGLELGADDYMTKPFSPKERWRASVRCFEGSKMLRA